MTGRLKYYYIIIVVVKAEEAKDGVRWRRVICCDDPAGNS